DFDDEIAARAVAQRAHSALAQAEALARLRPRRYADASRPVDGRHLDFCAQRGLVNRDRDSHVNIVAVAPEERVRLHMDGDVEIPGLAAVASDVPLAGHTNPRTIGEPRRQLEGERFGAHLHLLPAAGWTRHVTQMPRPAADGA